jgi:DNA-3-methyladenine glycosylase I
LSKDRGLVKDPSTGVIRCWWCGSDPLYVKYHDEEWGMPELDDLLLFEKICLEGFQAGLSWITILRKRENFRKAFADFDFREVAKFGSRKVNQLQKDDGIVRHRGKIESTINNAKQAQKIVDSFGSLADYFWSFEPKQPKLLLSRADVATTTEASMALSKDLKKRGWSFVGPTTCHAFMQAMGIVNDHIQGCSKWQSVDQAQAMVRNSREASS